MASVYNPTDKEISVMVRGVTYKVGPNAILSGVPLEVANNWKQRTHSFISVSEEDQVTEKIAEEKVEEKTEPEAPVEKTETKSPIRRIKR